MTALSSKAIKIHKRQKEESGKKAREKLYAAAGKSRAGTKERAKLYRTGSAGEAARQKLYSGRKAGGTVKKQVGGLPVGYDARLDESLAARHPAVRGNLAARRAESMGMERALGRGPYSGARTMVKKDGSVSRKKGGTTSRGKIMQGYKAGGKV